jgi:hypothetical protein
MWIQCYEIRTTTAAADPAITGGRRPLGPAAVTYGPLPVLSDLIADVRAQLDPPMGRILRQFNRMRIRGHDAEYPPTDSPEITPDDVREDQRTAVGLIDLAARLIDEMSPF